MFPASPLHNHQKTANYDEFTIFITRRGLTTIGGDALIRGSLAASQRLGVSPLLSGLVIVGFGTSVPELVVSVNAALNQQPDIAIGNVVGSNIGNVLLILGICALIALIAPLTIEDIAISINQETGRVRL